MWCQVTAWPTGSYQRTAKNGLRNPPVSQDSCYTPLAPAQLLLYRPPQLWHIWDHGRYMMAQHKTQPLHHAFARGCRVVAKHIHPLTHNQRRGGSHSRQASSLVAHLGAPVSARPASKALLRLCCSKPQGVRALAAPSKPHPAGQTEHCRHKAACQDTRGPHQAPKRSRNQQSDRQPPNQCRKHPKYMSQLK